MRFFLVGRDRVSGDVRILSERTFESRRDALDSLSTLTDADAVDSTDLFVVDLEAVTPVVLYRPAVAPAPETPIAAAWEAPVDEPNAELAGLLEPIDEEEEPSVARAGDEGLASALRRAATRMESEGVQPAATVEEVLASQAAVVEGAPAIEEAPAVEEPPAIEEAPPIEEPLAVEEPLVVEEAPAAEVDDDLAAELDALSTVPDAAPAEDAELATVPEADEAGLLSLADLPAPEAVDEVAAPLTGEPASWPWEPTPAAPETSGVVEPASLQFTPTEIEEPAAVASDMLPVPEDDFTPKPVIMGDYGASDDLVVIDEPVVEAEPADDAPVGIDELGIPTEWLADVPEVVIEPGAPEPDEDGGSPLKAAPEAPADAGTVPSEPIDDLLDSLSDEKPAEEAPAYQPDPIDMEAYTCDDCVYAGTCPKAGQDGPATCGSFQWKSM